MRTSYKSYGLVNRYGIKDKTYHNVKRENIPFYCTHFREENETDDAKSILKLQI